MASTMIAGDVLRLAKAKHRAAEWMPYLTSVFMPMRCIRSTRVKTAAVDRYGRMYYNPEFSARLDIDVLAYVILHETLHCVLSHCRRTDRMVVDKTRRNLFVANVAQDICIQQALARQLRRHEPRNIVTLERFSHIPGIVAGRTSEQYYEALLAYDAARCRPADDGDTAGLPQAGPVLDPADAGSNSDGIGRDYEEEPTLADIAGMEKKLRDVEAKLDDMDPRPGTTPDLLRQSVRARLHPLPDPFDQLAHAIGRSITSPGGVPDLTYRAWPRRQAPGDFRMRGVRRHQPEATIMLDTSGSLHDGSVKAKALAIVAKGIARLLHPRIVCCDEAIRSAKRVASMARFTWDGGGGTDMAAGLVRVDETYKPDAIVIITDGFTHWPARPTRARVVCALCRPEQADQIPNWVTVVHLSRKARSYAL